jgi:hypothetical protein
VFSKFLLDGFNNQGAREPLSRDVTFKSLNMFADKMTRGKSKQIPYSIDGGLAADIFFKQTAEPMIASEVRDYVAKKSSYRKLFILCSYLLKTTFPTDRSFYRFVTKRKPQEFLTPIKVQAGVVKYSVVGLDTFKRYLDLSRLLGVVEKDMPLRLTPKGKWMMRRDGKFYNIGLLDAVKRMWMSYGLQIADIEDTIGTRIKNNGVPSIEGIYMDMFLGKKVSIRKELFKVLLDLTGYVGALKYSADRTFFLVSSEEG